MAQTNNLWSNLLLAATKSPRMMAGMLGISNPGSYTTSNERDDIEKTKTFLLNTIAGATKPFAKGANILAQGYGDLYRGLSGNTQAVSPLESYIKSGISQGEMNQINENPYKEILKSGVGMASRLAPFATGGVWTGPGTAGTRAFDFMNVSRNPLINQASQMALRGTVEGGMAGFGDSENGNELRDTLTGAGIGAGSELLAGYLTNPQFRQLLNENVSRAYNMSKTPGTPMKYSDLLSGDKTFSAGSPSYMGEATGNIDSLRDRALKSVGMQDDTIQQLNDYYASKGAQNSIYKTDIEALSKLKDDAINTPEVREYLTTLRSQGLVEPGQVDMTLKYSLGIDPKSLGTPMSDGNIIQLGDDTNPKAYVNQRDSYTPEQMGRFQQMLGDEDSILTNLDAEPEILGGNFQEDIQPLGNTVPKNTKMIRDHMNTTGMPDPTDDPDAYKELLKTYKDRGILPDGTVRQPEVKEILSKRGVKGDRLLDAQDLVDEISSVGAKINNDGTVTLYHHTNSPNKTQIENSGKMFAKEPSVFFTTKPNGQASGFGDSVIKLNIPIEDLELDDLFGDEAHLKVKIGQIGKALDISKWLKR